MNISWIVNIKRMVGPFAVGLLMLSGLTIACNRPKGIIPEKQLIKVLADLETARVWQRSSDVRLNSDSVSYAVMKSNDITPEQLDSTLEWYGRNVDDYQVLYAKVEKELDKRLNAVSKFESRTESEEGLKDLWPSSRFTRLSKSDMMPGINFNIDNPDIEPGEVLEWRLRPVSGNNLEIILGGEYEGGEFVYNNSSIYARNTTMVKLYTDSTRRMKRIFGSIEPHGNSLETVMIDSLALVVLPKDDDQYFRTFHQKKYSILPKRKKFKHESKEISDSTGN